MFVFPLEATVSKFLIMHTQVKDVRNQRKSEAQAIPYKTRLSSVRQTQVVQAPKV